MLGRELVARLELMAAVEQELTSRNRLLPRRWDYLALARHSGEVERLLRPVLRRGARGVAADVIFAHKGWRGARPLSVLALEDRILYRALVAVLTPALPERIRQRASVGEFRLSPLEVAGVAYVSKTDINAYYEYVDHVTLGDELIAQTGEEPAVVALMDLLSQVMGRRVGLPQVHPASDVLGDTYIDPIRRRMLRQGIPTFTYSDDFRIASFTLGGARKALETCAAEARRIGLVLNERKTYTYRKEKYRRSLASYQEAERALFVDEDHSASDFLLLGEDYFGEVDEADEAEAAQALGDSPVQSDIEDVDAVDDGDVETSLEEIDDAKIRAAGRAWDLWLHEDESEESQAAQAAAITQSLLGRALPILGAAGDVNPLELLEDLLRFEPALAPEVSAYLTSLAATGRSARSNVRRVLDDVVDLDILNPWQGMWVAQAAGSLRTSSRRQHAHIDWLNECVLSGPSGLAATAAASLGRLRLGDKELIADTVDRVGPVWRQLVLWGLGAIDLTAARSMADSELDRLVLDPRS